MMFGLLLLCVIAAAADAKEDFGCSGLDCSHGCKEERSGNKCTCPGDLILGPDSKTCEGPVSLLLLTSGGLKYLREGQSDLNSVLTFRSYAFDYDFSKKKIYSYVGEEIISYEFANSNLSGKPLSTTSVVEVDTRVTSLALDWVHSQLYWVCRQRTLLETAGTDGSGRKAVASFSSEEDSGDWTDVVVDPYAEKLFWMGSKELYISDLNGQYNKTSLTTFHMEHLTVDRNNRLIYIIGYHGNSNLGDKVVVRYRYDGSQMGEEVTLGQGGSTVYGLGIFGNTLYWQSDYLGENIYKADTRNFSLGKNAKVKVTSVMELYQVVRSFKVYQPEIQQAPKVIK